MTNDISERIKRMLPSMSKGQKKIATAILSDCEDVAYMTAAELGRTVHVSESTVVRFAGLLGYEGYKNFQRGVEELVHNRLTPNQRIEITRKRIGRDHILDKVMAGDASRIRNTLDTIDREAFDGAINDILAAKNVYILGARSASALAYFLHHNLSLIMGNVKLIQPTSAGEVFEQLFDIGPADALIAFSFPRYSTKIIKAVQFAKQQDAKTVAITDSTSSPLAELASHLLTARSDMASFADSLVAPLSILNALIAGIADRRQVLIEKRFNKLEEIWSEFDIYAKR